MAKHSLKERRRRKEGKRRGEKILKTALSLHQSGDLAGAERLYREVIVDNPLQPVALHHLGLLVHQRGARAEAIELLERGLAVDGRDVTVWNNLGNFYQESARLEDATRAYRQAVGLAPKHINALHNLASILIDTGDPAGAARHFRGLIDIDAGDVDAWHGLGVALDATQDQEAAENAYRKALEREPNMPGAWYDLGNLLRSQDKLDEAREALMTAVRIEPGFAEAHNNLGNLYREMGELEAAVASFRRSLSARPNHRETYQNLASALVLNNELTAASEVVEKSIDLNSSDPGSHLQSGEIWFMREAYEKAEQAFRKAIEIKPGLAAAHSALGKTLGRLAKAEEAEAACRRAIELEPELADAYGNLGAALKFQTRLGEAIEAYRSALALDPSYPETYNNLGLAYVDAGDFENADICYRKALELEPDMPEVLVNIAMSKKHSASDKPAIEKLEAQLERDNLRSESRVAVHFALGKVFDDCGKYDEAFEHYSRGNAAKAEGVRFDRGKHVTMMKSLRDTFDRDLFSHLRGCGDNTALPVFIVGMPRSGTSLVEQILASHPLFHGADELTLIWSISKRLSSLLESANPYPECVRDMVQEVSKSLAGEYLAGLTGRSGEALRVSDKMPYNYLHLGLIAVLFPNAKVIHCKRDPRDVCLSNFFQLYAHAHHYTYRLEDLALYHREYERLMSYWYEHLPLEIHEVVYEELVEDLEECSRSLVDYVNLDWDERCLQFHTTKRSVQTASHWQVRQPLYRSSVERWRGYETQLGAFFDQLNASRSV